MNKKINKLINEFGISSDIQLRDLAKKLKIKLNYIGFAENLQTLPIKDGSSGLRSKSTSSRMDGSWIINLGDSHLSGTHWTCLFIEKNNAFYFDSFAGAPEDILINWLETNGIKTLIYNDYFQMQKLEETLCGIYCMVFLYYMTHSKKKKLIERFHEFTKSFTDLDGDYSSGSII